MRGRKVGVEEGPRGKARARQGILPGRKRCIYELPGEAGRAVRGFGGNRGDARSGVGMGLPHEVSWEGYGSVEKSV